ncbi:putative multi antimicrobial extrusion protein [Helianthus anomalus]
MVSRAVVKDLVPVVKLSISSGIMLCLELWTYGTMLFWSYLLDTCQTLSLNINSWEFMISLSFYGAGCVRVANELVRGNAKVVKFSIKVLLVTSGVIGAVFFVLCLVFRKNIAHLFTNDERVADIVSDLSLLLSFSVLLMY